MENWKFDKETVEMCVSYLIKKGMIKLDARAKWNLIDDMNKEFEEAD